MYLGETKMKKPLKEVKYKSKNVWNNQVSVPSNIVQKALDNKVSLRLCYYKNEVYQELVIPCEEIPQKGWLMPQDFHSQRPPYGTYKLYQFRLPRVDVPTKKKQPEVPQGQASLF